MKFKLEIDLDNDAFYQNRRREIIRILNELVDTVELHGKQAFDARIKDINGNTVGRATIE